MFEKGDIIQFKSWDEMVKQYGTDYDGDIKCRGSFTRKMRAECRWDKKYVISRFNGTPLHPNSKVFIEVTKPDSFFDSFYVSVDMVKLVDRLSSNTKKKIEILISSDNAKYTNATLKVNGVVVNTAIAKCAPEDVFDIKEGARIAIERVMGDMSELVQKSRKEYHYYHNSYGTKTKMKRYNCVGGTETKFKDVKGNKLYVGDVVLVVSDDGTCYGSVFVLSDDNGNFIDGIKLACNSETGKIDMGFTIIKQRNYDDDIDDLVDKKGKLNNTIRVYE